MLFRADFAAQDLQLVIFWGSQSGRAEVLAKRMASSVEKRFGLRTLVADLNDHDHIHLSELRPNDLCAFFLLLPSTWSLERYSAND